MQGCGRSAVERWRRRVVLPQVIILYLESRARVNVWLAKRPTRLRSFSGTHPESLHRSSEIVIKVGDCPLAANPISSTKKKAAS
jgi:hypothetical protein